MSETPSDDVTPPISQALRLLWFDPFLPAAARWMRYALGRYGVSVETPPSAGAVLDCLERGPAHDLLVIDGDAFAPGGRSRFVESARCLQPGLAFATALRKEQNTVMKAGASGGPLLSFRKPLVPEDVVRLLREAFGTERLFADPLVDGSVYEGGTYLKAAEGIRVLWADPYSHALLPLIRKIVSQAGGEIVFSIEHNKVDALLAAGTFDLVVMESRLIDWHGTDWIESYFRNPVSPPLGLFCPYPLRGWEYETDPPRNRAVFALYLPFELFEFFDLLVAFRPG